MNNETETLSVLAPTADPLSYAAICIDQEQPLTAAERFPLNHQEKQMLRDNELRIEQGLNSYFEIGRALRVIRLGKLYREEFDTFHEYCLKRWGFGRHRGYQYINSSIGAEEMLNFGQQPLANERQQRLLMKLPDANARARALKRAEALAGEGKMSGTHIKEAVNEELGIAPPILDAAVVNETVEPLKASTGQQIIVLNSNEQDNETNEQAIERLFSSIREFAAGKQWQPAFHDMLNELERRVDKLIAERQVSEAA